VNNCELSPWEGASFNETFQEVPYDGFLYVSTSNDARVSVHLLVSETADTSIYREIVGNMCDKTYPLRKGQWIRYYCPGGNMGWISRQSVSYYKKRDYSNRVI